MSFAIAWRETPRMRAASAGDIHSSGLKLRLNKLVDKVNLFLIKFLRHTVITCVQANTKDERS